MYITIETWNLSPIHLLIEKCIVFVSNKIHTSYYNYVFFLLIMDTFYSIIEFLWK